MSILSNWKANRQARIDAARARKAVEDTERKVDPRSKSFTVFVEKKLIELGITDIETRAKCAKDLFQSSVRCMKALSLDIAAHREPDASLQQQADDMKRILTVNGITDEETQDNFIIDYYTELKSQGMK